jgi:hypothetical protein
MRSFEVSPLTRSIAASATPYRVTEDCADAIPPARLNTAKAIRFLFIVTFCLVQHTGLFVCHPGENKAP